jgi:poly(A) polymerase/tRNA nucleotidyltransferase (CCA-adding enzyme)
MKSPIVIPAEVRDVVRTLVTAGYQAYPVGGCVRDALRGIAPRDWDITTSAKPEEILSLFPESFYENKFLTVTVKMGSPDPALAEIEVTTYRSEGKYTDRRHPDEVRYAATLEEDLSRRDFTVNAMALNGAGVITDPFGGRDDLKEKLIRAVGDPDARLGEDALRMVRAVRLAAELDFAIEDATAAAIRKNAGSLAFVSGERVRDELVKLMMSPRPRRGIETLHEMGLLRHIIPELEQGIGMVNRPKYLTIWEHNLKALEYAASAGYPLDARLAALLHDVAKPATRGAEKNAKNDEWTFYGHDVVGGRMAAAILTRLHFPATTVEKIATLIRWHLFKYDPDEGITDSSIRRLIRNVGADRMDDLVRLRICDRMGMGVPKALPYRLRHFQFRVEQILREEEAPSVKKLKINGDSVMKILDIGPGRIIGRILEVLLQEVMDDPAKNTPACLEDRVRELAALSDAELVAIAERAESRVEMVEDQRESEIKRKYFVK